MIPRPEKQSHASREPWAQAQSHASREPGTQAQSHASREPGTQAQSHARSAPGIAGSLPAYARCKRVSNDAPWRIAALAVFLLALGLPAHAANPSLLEGIESYKAGNYREAVGHFGSALATEFDNAVLHYYLANTLLNMKQREAAIREFRIAYALAPKKEAGTLSRQALVYLGADNYDDGIVKPVAEKTAKKDEKPESVDPVFEKTMQMLKRQADDAGLESKMMTPQEIEATRLLDENLKKSKTQVVDSLLKVNPEELHLPPEAMGHMIRVKQLNDERMRRVGHVVRRSGSVRESAESLQNLLHEKNSKTAPKLVPIGTNLYTRNYENKNRIKTGKATTKPAEKTAD